MNIAILHYPITCFVTSTDLELAVNPQGAKFFDTDLTLPLRLGDIFDEHLKLVISEKGHQVLVKYGVSSFTNIDLAKKNLADYSKCKISEIGFVNLLSSESSSRVSSVAYKVIEWAAQNKFDAVLWLEGTENPHVIGHELELVSKDRIYNVYTKSYLRKVPGPLSDVNQQILASDIPSQCCKCQLV